MKMLLSEIAGHVGGKLLGEDLEIASVSIDTRTLSEGDLYHAIKGQNFDGHQFIDKAELAGAKAVLVENEVESDLPQIIVKDSHLALAELAAAWKHKAEVTTVGITGSNGKTTVKEMVAAILAVNNNVLFTQGNLNNDIGVPLTLLKLNKRYQFAVIEMGANHVGEIAYCSHYAMPDVALITNVGAAHLEGFGSIENIAKAKGEIIQNLADDGVAILNKDDAFFALWVEMAGNRSIRTFGFNEGADVRAENIVSGLENNEFVTRFTLLLENQARSIQLKLAGKHSVLNALAAIACSLELGVKIEQIERGLEQLDPVKGRLQPLVGTKGCIVIDDTYNANPNSFKAALEVLNQCEGDSWVALGALGEMGPESLKIHEKLGELIKSMNVVRLLAIGSDAKSTSNMFGKGATFFNTQQQLVTALMDEIQGRETILVKGSRAQKMENVVAALVADSRK